MRASLQSPPESLKLRGPGPGGCKAAGKAEVRQEQLPLPEADDTKEKPYVSLHHSLQQNPSCSSHHPLGLYLDTKALKSEQPSPQEDQHGAVSGPGARSISRGPLGLKCRLVSP